MIQCVVNFELGRVRVYDNENLDAYYNFNKEEEDDWKSVVESAGFNLSEMIIQTIQPVAKKEVSEQDEPDLLDILSSCTHAVREERAGDIVSTYLKSIQEILSGREPITKPEVESDWALTAENYPKGITINVICSTPTEYEECLKRCKALHEDLQMLYDNPAEIFMTQVL